MWSNRLQTAAASAITRPPGASLLRAATSILGILLLTTTPTTLSAAMSLASSPLNIEPIRPLGGQGTYIHLVGQSLFLAPANVERQAKEPGTWFDLSADPAAPVVVNEVLPCLWDLVLIQDYALACDYRECVIVYDTRGHKWREVEKLALPSMAENIRLRGHLAYVANHTAGVSIVDVSTPEIPVVVGSLNPGIDCDALAFWKDTVVLYGHWESRIVVADISDPTHPRQVAACQLPEKLLNGFEMEVTEGFAYATTTNGLAIVDVNQPEDPRLVNMVEVGLPIRDLVLLDQLAFVAASEAGVLVLDISDPAHPREVGRYAADGFSATGLAAQRAGGSARGHYVVYTAGESPTLLRFRVPTAGRPPG